jgi:hypothetical protein
MGWERKSTWGSKMDYGSTMWSDTLLNNFENSSLLSENNSQIIWSMLLFSIVTYLR